MVKKEDKSKKRTTALVFIVGVALILAAVAFGTRDGWFLTQKVVLNEEYIGEFTDYKNISAEEYEELVNKKDSFVLFVDQGGCETADRLKGFTRDWASEKKIKVLRIMFSEMKKTSLHEFVKYYPSVAIISKGKPVGYLKADSDEDSDKYNKYFVFYEWINKYF